ncbi:MAG TPA: YihY/virulence factor BrkB family protein [Ktedonobacteraceae bacterium]
MQNSPQDTKRQLFVNILEKQLARIGPLRELFVKFNNDWGMNSASGLAYNLMTAMVPVFIALVAIFGLTIGNLNAQATADLIARIQQLFPVTLHAIGIIDIALTSLRQKAGILGVLAVLAAIFGGSRLFVSIEGYFDIIYRTAPRNIISQNIMAILMMLAFLVLIPLLVFASSAPALLHALALVPVINQIPGVIQLTSNVFILGLAGVFTGLVIGWILFEIIYIVVPNQKLSFRHSWRGALVAAFGLEVFLVLFPFYITHFMGSYTGTAGFLLILLVFFYYFAVILLMGAEINAYFALNIPPLPDNIAVVLRDAVKQKADNGV